MSGLNMIDKMGYGIHDMNLSQAKRYLPLPDYDVSDPNAVRMTIYGGVVDPTYTQMLMQKTSLAFMDILALDRVQKKLPIPDAAATRLKRARLIEGRKPYYHVSAVVANATASKADYIHTRAQDNVFYAKLVTDFISKFGKATRPELEKLLFSKLSDALSEEQKVKKVSNLLTSLRRSGKIRNIGPRKVPQWVLAE